MLKQIIKQNCSLKLHSESLKSVAMRAAKAEASIDQLKSLLKSKEAEITNQSKLLEDVRAIMTAN